VRQGLLPQDLFHGGARPVPVGTARYADMWLPAATYLESEDVYRAPTHLWLQYGGRVMPQGEAG